jgi:transaldolase
LIQTSLYILLKVCCESKNRNKGSQNANNYTRTNRRRYQSFGWIMAQLPELGISIDKVTDQLEDEAVRKFDEPFDKLMESLTKKLSE